MIKKQYAGITGIGAYVPPNILTNKNLEKIVDTNDEWITSRTGIKERRIVDKEIATSDLAYEASVKAIKNANIKPEEIDLIVVATITPDMVFPSTACLLQNKLGAKNAVCFDVSAGCTGFVYALSIVSQYIENGIYEKALIVGAEVLSKIVNWDDRTTCVLFGDGAGAAVLECVSKDKGGVLSTYLGTEGWGAELLKQPAGGTRLPASSETVENNLHTIYMKGNEVFKFAVKAMEEATLKALSICGLTIKDVSYIVPHQANIRIIQSAIKRLKLPKEKFIINVDKYGNMSGASIPVALTEGVESGKFRSGDIIVLVGFGAGLTLGASVIKWL
jgi:3-oxoacyl-[acyl-carrier-protein] synthase-3